MGEPEYIVRNHYDQKPPQRIHLFNKMSISTYRSNHYLIDMYWL